DLDASQSIGQGGVKRYDWQFSDGESLGATTPIASHTFADLSTSKASITLTVTDSKGNRSPAANRELDPCAPDRLPVDLLQYADLLRCVEARLPGESPRQILSTIRKIYFGSEPWSHRRDSNWDDIITCGQAVPDPRAALPTSLYWALIGSANTVAEGDVS